MYGITLGLNEPICTLGRYPKFTLTRSQCKQKINFRSPTQILPKHPLCRPQVSGKPCDSHYDFYKRPPNLIPLSCPVFTFLFCLQKFTNHVNDSQSVTIYTSDSFRLSLCKGFEDHTHLTIRFYEVTFLSYSYNVIVIIDRN